jgi:F-type H+-transporting ATPase subunit delta
VILRGVAKRYAVALFNAAVKMDVAEQVQGDLAGFDHLLRYDARFRAYMRSPQILNDTKKELIFKAFAEQSSGLFVNFVTLLIDKKRLDSFTEIAEAYTHLYERSQGIIEVKAITAVALDRDLEHKTRETLEQQTGRQVRLVKTTDPDIIGGMILIIEDKIIDGSIRHQLGTLRKELSALKVH